MTDIVKRLRSFDVFNAPMTVEGVMISPVALMAADEIERLCEALADKDEALLRVAQWAEAYPEDIFPPVDIDAARRRLDDDALFSRLHAEWARRLCKGIGGIARAALGEDRCDCGQTTVEDCATRPDRHCGDA